MSHSSCVCVILLVITATRLLRLTAFLRVWFVIFVRSIPCSSCFFDSTSKSRRKAATLNYVPHGKGGFWDACILVYDSASKEYYRTTTRNCVFHGSGVLLLHYLGKKGCKMLTGNCILLCRYMETK